MKNLKIYRTSNQNLKKYIVKREAAAFISIGLTLLAACATSCNTKKTDSKSELESITTTQTTTINTNISSYNETKIESFTTTTEKTITVIPSEEPTTNSLITFPQTQVDTSGEYTKETNLTTTTTFMTQNTTTPEIVITTVPTNSTQMTTVETTKQCVYSTLPDNFYLGGSVNPLIDSYYNFYYDDENKKIKLTQDNINKPWYFPAYIEQIALDKTKYDGYVEYIIYFGSEEYWSMNLYYEKLLTYTILYSDYLEESVLKNMYGKYGIFTRENKKISLEDIEKSLYMIKKYKHNLKEDIQMAGANYNVEGFLPEFNKKLDELIEQIDKNPEQVANEFYEKFNSKVYIR